MDEDIIEMFEWMDEEGDRIEAQRQAERLNSREEYREWDLENKLRGVGDD